MHLNALESQFFHLLVDTEMWFHSKTIIIKIGHDLVLQIYFQSWANIGWDNFSGAIRDLLVINQIYFKNYIKYYLQVCGRVFCIYPCMFLNQIKII